VNTKNLNIETRISNRAKSIFAAFGTIINDFYLEAGIYFVGGFNAALVAWDIYTNLIVAGQPLTYAIVVAVIAFVAVEGLAVYLVGAAAKTNNGLLWFFSVIFAGFFTYAHYQEMTYRAGVITQYVTLAIPFFVVVGYWARTIKVEIEAGQAYEIDQRNNEAARQHQLEDEDRQLNRQLRLDKVDKNYQLELVRIEAEKGKNIGQNGEFLANSGTKLSNANQAKKDKISHRRETILTIMAEEKLTQAELARRLGVSLGTVKNDLKAMNGKV
jgi:DNA-binding CsgD family transcriptional regulator